MWNAWATGDLAELARLAHWLKGSGGTAGFDAFTAPARELELLVKQEKSADVEAAIAELQNLSNRIVIPSEATAHNV